MRVEITPEDERRWKPAAEDRPLLEWLRSVANAAADEALESVAIAA